MDESCGLGRDRGIVVHDDYLKSPRFEGAFGVFNGTGEKSILSATA